MANTWLLRVGLKTLPFALIQPNLSNLDVLPLKSQQLPLWRSLAWADSDTDEVAQWESTASWRVLQSFEDLVEILLFYTQKAWEAPGLTCWQVVNFESIADLSFSCTFFPPSLLDSLFFCFLTVMRNTDICQRVRFLRQYSVWSSGILWLCLRLCGALITEIVKIIMYSNVTFQKPFCHCLLSSGTVVVQHFRKGTFVLQTKCTSSSSEYSQGYLE